MRKSLFAIFCLLIMIAWLALVFLLVYPSSGKLGNYFAISVFYIITRQVSFQIGIFLLFLRLISVIKPTHLIYVLIGTLNAGVGIMAIILYFSGLADRQWLNISLYNLLLSLILLADSFWGHKNTPVV